MPPTPPRQVPPTIEPSGAQSWGQTPSPGPAVPMAERDPAPLPAVARGSLYVFRQFDIADEIDLARVEALKSSLQRTPLSRPRTAIFLSNPPVAMPLGSRALTLAGRSLPAEIAARIFEFGVVSIRMRVQLASGTPWAELSTLVGAAQLDEAITRVAREALAELSSTIAGAISGLREHPTFEDYVVAQIEGFEPAAAATALPLEALARLLLGERVDAQLSPGEVQETTRYRTSYYGDDLCVAAWNCAVVVDPSGDPDMVDVLDLANAQLLELRFYDELLDRELARLYEEVARRRGKWPALFRNYGPVLRRAMVVMLEIAEFIERVENSLKIIGDVYLARVYAGAVEALRIPAWEQSVTRKHRLVRQVYDVLKNEVDASRDQLLEATIVALIVGEIFLAMHVTR